MGGGSIGGEKSLLELEVDGLKKVVDLKVLGSVLGRMVFGDVMVKEKKGCIVKLWCECGLGGLRGVVG